MKNKIISVLIALIMIFCVFCASAYADDGISISTSVGSDGEWLISGTAAVERDLGLFSGKMPEGMRCEVRSGKLYLCGAAEEAGYYVFTELVQAPFHPVLTLRVEVSVIEAGVTVTVSPTDQTAFANGTVSFSVSAENCTGIYWRFVTPDRADTVDAGDAQDQFPGIELVGANTGKLTINNVSPELDGWFVEAMLEGADGPVFSDLAKLSVMTIKQPDILIQPVGGEAEPGESVSLRVVAGTTDGSYLAYQWYSTTDGSSLNGTPIVGETASDLTVACAEGKVYYYCEVTAVKGDYQSEPLRTDCVAVVGIKAEEPEPEEEAEETVEAEPAAAPEPTAEPVQAPEPTPVPAPAESEEPFSRAAFFVIGLAAGSAVCGATALIVKSKSRKEGK